MTPVKEASSLIAATMGVGSAVVQGDPVVPIVHPLLVPIVSAVIGGIVSFAVLRVTVQELRDRAAKVETKLDNISTRLSRLEGRWDRYDREEA